VALIVAGAPSVAASPANPIATLPKHVLEGYRQDFTNPARPLKLAQVPTDYNLVAVAFANSTSTPGQVSFAIDPGLSSALGGYSIAQFQADVATLHHRGQHVVLSVGGQNGNVTIDSAASANAFARSAAKLMTRYGFDGVDIDLESGINVTWLARALRRLSSLTGSRLVITMAPQTIDISRPVAPTSSWP
jgi:chitinase